jgi:hypothetical protein
MKSKTGWAATWKKEKNAAGLRESMPVKGFVFFKNFPFFKKDSAFKNIKN